MHPNRKYKLNENFFNEIDTEEKAYWLGYVLADGCVHQRTLTIYIKGSDKKHLAKFLKDIQSEHPIYKSNKKYIYKGEVKISNGYEINVTSVILIKDLIKLGITPNKTLTVKIPKVREDLRKHMWRGIFDGDGSISSDLHNIQMHGTKEVIIEFCNILKKLGCKYRYVPRKDINHAEFQMCGERNTVKALTYLYKNSTIYLDRKFKLYQKKLSKGFRYYTDTVKQKALNLLKVKSTFKEVADIIGCSPVTIRQWYIKNIGK